MLYKDACNFKSNQKNLGTIKSSNLCTEIVEYTAPDEVTTAVLFSVVHFVISVSIYLGASNLREREQGQEPEHLTLSDAESMYMPDVTKVGPNVG